MENVVVRWLNRPRKIAWHLASYATVLAIPAVILVTVIGYQYISNEKSSIYESSLRWVHAAAANIDNEIAADKATLDVLATSSEALNGDFRSLYDRIKGLHLVGGAWVFVTDRAGNILISTRMSTPGPYGTKALTDLNDEVFRTKKTIVTGILYGPNSNEWVTAITKTVPEGLSEPLYAIYYTVPAHRWMDLLNEVSTPQGWFITLDDAEGNIIARTINHDKYVGKPSVQPIYDRIRAMNPGDSGTWDDIISIDHKPIVGAYYKIFNGGWVVTVSAGATVYQQPVFRALTIAGLTTLAMAMTSWFAARSISRRLTNAIMVLEIKSNALKAEKVIDLSPTIVKEVNVAIDVMREAAETLVHRAESQNLMLRELNHRVKNSLQNVASVLRMQQRASPPEAREALNAASLRVTAIGRVHEGLYNAEDMSISSIYFEKLLKDVAQAMMVDFDTELHNMSLDIDLAVPLSLLLNEAVVNAIKYGKPHDKPDYTPVNVYFGPHNDLTHWRLTVRDYGRGFPPNFEELRHSTIGIKLMKMMAVQTNGELTFTNHPSGGALVTVIGPVRIPKINHHQ